MPTRKKFRLETDSTKLLSCFEQIKKLADAERDGLGFIPEQGLYDAISRNKVMALIDDNANEPVVAGYIFHSGVYPDAILSGAKTVELRRRIPALSIGTCLWIYATRPRGAVIGTAVVSEVIRGTPEEIWEVCSDDAAIDRYAYDAYFDGSAEAFGIFLCEIVRREPISFESLKKIRSNFHPPQVLTRLSAQEALSLHKEAGADAW